MQVLNLFLALLLSSFSADNLAVPEEKAEKNNLQIAVGRIKKAFAFVKASLRSFFSSGCVRSKKQKKASDGLKHRVGSRELTDNSNHTNLELSQKNSLSDIDKETEHIISNPSLSVSVPIAEEESDFECLNTEDFSSLSSDLEEDKEVRLDGLLGQ